MLIKYPVAKNHTLIRVYANQYTYGTGGYPHKDSSIDTDLTFILYLNKDWKKEYAGATVFFKDDEAIDIVMPKYNRLIIFNGAVEHAGLEVSRLCPQARTVLVFKSKLNQI
jgi:SM-20-related protein